MDTQKNNSKVLVIYGPTGVGKSDLAIKIAKSLPNAHIINMDMGQLYTPLSIGTAKPDWANEPIVHHLFDVVNKPENITVFQYRALVETKIQQLWSEGAFPILVGGSGFYLKSLLFPPQDVPTLESNTSFETLDDDRFWHELEAIDSVRAAQIHPHDVYRLKRALEIWHTTGKKPSECAPVFNPIANTLIVHVTRDRDELYERINERVLLMMQQGWLTEVEALKGTSWEQFLYDKKIIGYEAILDYLQGPQDQKAYEALISLIQQRTRNYAKRQETLWRGLAPSFSKKNNFVSPYLVEAITINLTNSDANSAVQEVIRESYFF